jgi:hypothetical protein
MTDEAIQWRPGWSGVVDYVVTYGMAAEAEATEFFIALSAKSTPTQSELDAALARVSTCAEGSMICAVWWAVRAWGEHHGLRVPPKSAFPWGL